MLIKNHLEIIAVVIVIAISQSVNSQDEGNVCNHFGYRGICTKLPECPDIYEAAISGNPPRKLCNWGSSMSPIVCCRKSSNNPRPPDKNPFVPNNERIADRMCKEYGKYVYELVPSPVSLSSVPVMVNVSNCATDVYKLIVGGRKAEPKEFPHMAAIGFAQSPNGQVHWSCGGTLISDKFVLTAAHCTFSASDGPAQRIRVGGLSLVNTQDAQEVRIKRKIQHPNYKPPAKYNDIALLELERPVKFTKYVRPACLFTKSKLPTNENPIATGWGVVSWISDTGSNDLLKVSLPLISESKCRQSYSGDYKLPNGIDTQSQICAGGSGKDTCQGDSGGPLVVTSSQHCMHDVIGITSFGKLCGSPAPGVYTKVQNYISWIESIVWSN